MNDDELILDSLKDLGVRLWVKDGELHFKYPEGLEGNGRKDLYLFIKKHEEGIMRVLRNKNGN